MTLHAGLVAARRDGRWAGVLLRGPSGAGKSALCLRAMEAGWRVVADDRVALWTSGGRLYGRAPRSLSGLIEVRGLGVVRAGALQFCRVVLVLDALAPGEAAERMPEPEREAILGADLARARMDFHAPVAVARLSLALDAALRPDLLL